MCILRRHFRAWDRLCVSETINRSTPPSSGQGNRSVLRVRIQCSQSIRGLGVLDGEWVNLETVAGIERYAESVGKLGAAAHGAGALADTGRSRPSYNRA